MENIQAEEAMAIVRKILAPTVEPHKISSKQMKGYLAILLEGDRYRTICRVYMNNQRRKYLGTISKNKVESRNRIESMSDIFKYSDDLEAAVAVYCN